MQNKIQALPEKKRVSNRPSPTCINVSSGFPPAPLAPVFFFATQSSFLPLKHCILTGSIPVLFQYRAIPQCSFSLGDLIHAHGFNCHLGTAGSPPRPRSLALGLCICCLPAPCIHLDTLQVSHTQLLCTCSF